MIKHLFFFSLCLILSCTQTNSSTQQIKADQKTVSGLTTSNTATKVNTKPIKTNTKFNEFVALFQPITVPLSLTDAATLTFNRKQAIPKEWTKAFICDIEGSDFNCISEDPDPNMAYNLLQSYYPYGRLETSESFIGLIYHFSDLGYAQNYLATYTPNGQLISRILISGSKPNEEALDAHINDKNAIGTQEIAYVYKKKGQEDFIENIKTTRYRITSEGNISPLSSDEVLDVVLNALTDVPEVVAYKKEVIKQGKKFKLMPKTTYPSAVEADYYIKVGEDNDVNFVTWKHFYINPLDLDVKIYNLFDDEKMDLETWRKQ